MSFGLEDPWRTWDGQFARQRLRSTKRWVVSWFGCRRWDARGIVGSIFRIGRNRGPRFCVGSPHRFWRCIRWRSGFFGFGKRIVDGILPQIRLGCAESREKKRRAKYQAGDKKWPLNSIHDLRQLKIECIRYIVRCSDCRLGGFERQRANGSMSFQR